MARPKKLNADYFPHDANERNKTTIKAIRRKYSHTGYAVWHYLLETLTDSDNFRIPWDELNIELLAADYDVDAEQLQEIVAYAIKIGLLETDGEGGLFSAEHRNNLKPLVQKRERDRNNLANQIYNEIDASVIGVIPPVTDAEINENGQKNHNKTSLDGENGINGAFGGVIADDNPREFGENPQSKVKESKGEYKDSTHTVSFKRKGGAGENQAAADFLAWVEAYFPAVHTMAEPFNAEQAAAMLAKFRDEDITRIVEAIDNKGGTRNKSAYATFNSYVAHDHVLKERAALLKPHTYDEVCDLVSTRGYKMDDFEIKEIDGVKFWIKKIDLIRTQA